MKKLVTRIQREEAILSSLKALDYLTRSQIQLLHDLGSARNASRVLKDMEPFVSSFRDGESVYYLSAAGRERIGSKKIRRKSTTASHYVMRNSLYIAYGSPKDWRNEQLLQVEGKVSVICDAIFKRDGRYFIVEADHTQKMTANRSKISKYRKLLSLNVFEKPPVFVWITTTEYRRQQLASLCEGLDVQIFTVSDFH